MNEFYEERKSEIEEAINTVFRFQLYRRGKIDTFDDGGKVLGDCLDTILGCAVEYAELMKENKGLQEQVFDMMTKMTEEPFYKGEKETKNNKEKKK